MEHTYPEHEKLQNVKEESQFVGSFLDWAQSQGYFLAMRMDNEDDDGPAEMTVKVPKRIEELLAEYHDIDLKKLEEEKRHMLDQIRNQNAKK